MHECNSKWEGEGRSFMHLQYYSECRLGWEKERRGNICFLSPLFSLPIFQWHFGWIWNVKTWISSFSHLKVYHHVFPPQMCMSSSYLEISSPLPSPSCTIPPPSSYRCHHLCSPFSSSLYSIDTLTIHSLSHFCHLPRETFTLLYLISLSHFPFFSRIWLLLLYSD